MSSTVDATRGAERVDDAARLRKKVHTLGKMIKKSTYTVFFTGAGVSTSSGVGDYRGPSGAWTKSRIKELESNPMRTPHEEKELNMLLENMVKELRKADKKVSMLDAQPSDTHMAMATLIRVGLAHFVVTTNLDGIFRKAGLQGHVNLACLHGDIYIERCTGCGYDFERNWHTRQSETHVHDHGLGTCSRCGSTLPKGYTGEKTKHAKTGSGTSFTDNGLISTRDKNVGTKDTHINFGERLDKIDWNEAEEHCAKADLCIVAGTSMSLRHITHFPFMAKKTVIINLQATPDDEQAHLRIWATCDEVFTLLLEDLGILLDPIPVWHPRDALPVSQNPSLLIHITSRQVFGSAKEPFSLEVS
ncbi:transcriptional regulator, Sir2 family protein [Pelomyxa schiedti]|nr:transcriptional regulator, Sir2 family protein [Pelomyxa schiedti]